MKENRQNCTIMTENTSTMCPVNPTWDLICSHWCSARYRRSKKGKAGVIPVYKCMNQVHHTLALTSPVNAPASIAVVAAMQAVKGLNDSGYVYLGCWFTWHNSISVCVGHYNLCFSNSNWWADELVPSTYFINWTIFITNFTRVPDSPVWALLMLNRMT